MSLITAICFANNEFVSDENTGSENQKSRNAERLEAREIFLTVEAEQ